MWSGMQVTEVLAVLRDLQAAGCRVWVAGGWAADVLIGRQTRAHRDLDLAVDARDEAAALRLLGRRGYRLQTDWRPVRVELACPGAGWVDLHPVGFDNFGHGRQADLDGGTIDYPTAAFTSASIEGIEVGCLSATQQVEFRRGYPLRAIDLHDLEVLQVFDPLLGASREDASGTRPMSEAGLTAALPRLLRDYWGMEPSTFIASSGPVGMGSVTTGVDVHGLGRLVAKWVPGVAAKALDRGSAVAEELHRAGLSVGAAVPTATGELSVPLAGGRMALLHRVDGQPLTGASAVDQEQMARVLAQVHAVRQSWPSSDAYLDDSLGDARAVEAWVVPAVNAVRAEYRELPPVTWALVHHDPAPEAFFRDDMSGVTSLIDWTGAGEGPLLFDLASAAMYLGGRSCANVFVEHYLQLAPASLRAEAYEHLSFFTRFRAAVQAAYFSTRVAVNNLTGIDSQAENLEGLHHARCMLAASGVPQAT